MINRTVESLINRELNTVKKASMIVGVVTKSDQWITGEIYGDEGDVEIGNRVFEIGSTTKTFTSLLLSKLVLNNVIGLDEPIVSFKPEYRRSLSNNGKDVTFRHLATHTSGLPSDDMKKIKKRIKEHRDENDNPFKYYTHQDMNQFFIDFDLKTEVGKKWKYSNIATGLLGNILGEIVGLSYEEAMTTHVLQPLGMKDTFVTGNKEQNSRYILAYHRNGEKVSPFLAPAIDGAGTLKSTMVDMLQYVKQQIGVFDSPLNEAVELTHEIHSEMPWKNYHMGLGWIIEHKKWSEFPIRHHDGKTTGFQTYVGFIKEKQIGIVISSTVPLSQIKLLKKLIGLTGMLNEDIAETIFINYLNRK